MLFVIVNTERTVPFVCIVPFVYKSRLKRGGAIICFLQIGLVESWKCRTFVGDMENDNTIESQIALVLSDIREKGYSSVQPFSIGKVEKRMMQFAQKNNVVLACDDLYMSAKQLQHSMRASKIAKGLVVADADLINLPKTRFQMDLYYDGECFIYSDGQSKYIVHPNYQMKVSREVVRLVNFITATRVKDPAEFTLPKYHKI